MNILFLAFLACGEKETDDTGLDINLDDTDEETDTDTDDTDTDDTDTEDTGEEDTGEDTGEEDSPLEIIGEYEDNWGGFQVITEETWTSGDMSFNISQYNNELHTVIAQNDSSNQFNPDKWSKFQWTHDPHDNLFYCQVAFEGETEEDAIAVEPADPSNLEIGCGGFGWTMIREPLSITGNYTDNWGGSHSISPFRWRMGDSVFHIIVLSEDENYAVAQNGANNEWNANLWSKLEWTVDSDTLYYCQAAYDAATLDDALAASADATDLETGCDGFGWSSLHIPPSIAGQYVDNWGGNHDIQATQWIMGASIFHIAELSNEEQWIVAQNDSNNEWNPDLWSKLEWMVDSDTLYYCASAYDAASQSDAAAASADRTDLGAGCGGFGWSLLTEQPAIAGYHQDNWGEYHLINAMTWEMGDSVFHIQELSNDEQWLVAQNDSSNEWNPDLWSKFEWTYDSGTLYYCQSIFDAASQSDAAAASADRLDLVAGCGGFGWSSLTAVTE